MKITISQLRHIIKEEVQKARLDEVHANIPSAGDLLSKEELKAWMLDNSFDLFAIITADGPTPDDQQYKVGDRWQLRHATRYGSDTGGTYSPARVTPGGLSIPQWGLGGGQMSVRVPWDQFVLEFVPRSKVGSRYQTSGESVFAHPSAFYKI